jgi:hypothetical protein
MKGLVEASRGYKNDCVNDHRKRRMGIDGNARFGLPKPKPFSLL